MPNWCSTQITIHHDDVNKLKLLDALIDDWTSKNYKANGFGLTWLGNIVGNSGVATIDEDYKTDVRCRGSMTYKDLNLDGNELIIDTETAWAPMLQMWIRILNKYLPDAELTYRTEEPGCEIYCTNDPYLINKYVIDSWDDNIESDWEASEESVTKLLQKLLLTEETNIKSLIREFEESEYTENISIHQWEYVNENELD